MRNYKKILFGVALLIAGVLFAMNAIFDTDFKILFSGWWTLFIIIPCGVGLFTERDKFGNFVGLAIGVLLLLWKQDVIIVDHIWKLIVPIIIISVAIKMIITGLGRRGRGKIAKVSVDAPYGTAVFGGKDMNFDGQKFDGCELTAVFGGIDCDLRGAIIEKDCTIEATAVFGGIDIKVPEGVNVDVSSVDIFGGTDCVERKNLSAITIYVKATAVFGGVEII